MDTDEIENLEYEVEEFGKRLATLSEYVASREYVVQIEQRLAKLEQRLQATFAMEARCEELADVFLLLKQDDEDAGVMEAVALWQRFQAIPLGRKLLAIPRASSEWVAFKVHKIQRLIEAASERN